jgi:hypothetical protein
MLEALLFYLFSQIKFCLLYFNNFLQAIDFVVNTTHDFPFQILYERILMFS